MHSLLLKIRNVVAMNEPIDSKSHICEILPWKQTFHHAETI